MTVAPHAIENTEWIDSLDAVIQSAGPQRAGRLLSLLTTHADGEGVHLPFSVNTPYINTISAAAQPSYPGEYELEKRITSIIRWNAMAMVVRANHSDSGIGGHISTYASAANLIEVGFQHFFRGPDHPCGGDFVFFQGHTSPGIYARAYLEGRVTETDLANFRHELRPEGGLSSYPHPWLMPKFWQVPTVSMGLSPIMAIYQARFNRYLEDRGLKAASDARVWCFLGDGEMDEPESLGAITLAARERLNNLTFVINCNLQRLDGPVRGNGKIIQELEAAFRGAGWNVLKAIWGYRWDALLERDVEGALVKRMGEVVDGHYQKYKATNAQRIRDHFFGADPRLSALVAHMTNDDIWKLNRGGHDPYKVYAAYKAAVDFQDGPTVILAKTIKGYGLGEAGEGRNITHQQKKLNHEELLDFRDRFKIPLTDEEVATAPFYRPDERSDEIQYLKERRRVLGGSLPQRRTTYPAFASVSKDTFTDFHAGSGDRSVATTMAFVKLLSRLLKDPTLGQHLVPIIPDEARTFGMESLFREIGIYSHVGQLYEPVDSSSLLSYNEAKDGQLLEEGITEAGGMSSFIAAGTAYSTHGVPTIPFFLFYSMFGFQRIGDLIWAASDMRCRGFLIGATAGRTTLAGEGLQHQDGHSHLLAYPTPTVQAYDPAFAYEISVIVEEGIDQMYRKNQDVIYYLTVENEPYAHPAMPEGAREGILKGLYRFRESDVAQPIATLHLVGSGAILNEVIAAQEILAEYQVAAHIWSATSYKSLHQNAVDCERWNMLHPEASARIPHITQCLQGSADAVIAASDYVKALPNSVARFVDAPWFSLGTDGFGRSESRTALRDFFEVDRRYVAFAGLSALARAGKIPPAICQEAKKRLEIDPERINPLLR
jgi:pyruvate dehydrogenase E1 component